uniref:Homeobox domain-containing protein n=1 Tax=Timema monikensis TaxID=170555 RepID=A0A7R9E7B7_9NEOP|nr:unnamed protein product [Timema monikensis]
MGGWSRRLRIYSPTASKMSERCHVAATTIFVGDRWEVGEKRRSLLQEEEKRAKAEEWRKREKGRGRWVEWRIIAMVYGTRFTRVCLKRMRSLNFQDGSDFMRPELTPQNFSFRSFEGGWMKRTELGYGMDLNGARRKNATRETTSTLKAWLNEHKKNPYPTKGEKIMLAIITKMTLTQVSTWFANARRRLKKENKMTWEPRNRVEDEDNNNDDEGGRKSADNVKDPVDPSVFGMLHSTDFTDYVTFQTKKFDIVESIFSYGLWTYALRSCRWRNLLLWSRSFLTDYGLTDRISVDMQIYNCGVFSYGLTD